MAMEIPKAEKVYTTKYAGLKGVDFTNDPSNVWYRRSPDAVNMLPDEAGNPFKRTGWKIEVSSAQFIDLYSTDNPLLPAPSEITIRKCHYFELSGEDHIIIFTDIGVFVYREGTLLSSKTMNANSAISYDQDMIDSWDRAYFFEGGGKSAFYIYGGFKIWEYAYDETNGFTWGVVDPYIPSVNISVDARHESGVSYEAINMLSDYIAEDFQDNVYLSVTSSTTDITGATVTVDDTMFISVQPEAGTYVFTYTDADHSWLLGGDQVLISVYGITLTGSPVDGSTITVVLGKQSRINLPRRVISIEGMEVWVSVSTQFDTQLHLTDSPPATPQPTDCYLYIPTGTGNSYIVFYQDWLPLIDGEDAVKIIYPRNAVTATSHTTSVIEIDIGA